jgi:hypothetical protein
MASHYSLGLPTQLSFWLSPDRGEAGGTQVNRDRPGMRGNIIKYMTRNITKISKSYIRTLYGVAFPVTKEKTGPCEGDSMKTFLVGLLARGRQ